MGGQHGQGGRGQQSTRSSTGQGSAVLADPSMAAAIARTICSSCGLDPSTFIEKIAVGQSFSIQGVIFDRVGSYWAIYSSSPEAAKMLRDAAASVSKAPGSLFIETSYRDFDEVVKALKLAGGSLEQAIESPLYWAATSVYNLVKIHGSNAVGKISAVLRVFGSIIANRMARTASGEVDRLISAIQRYSRSGVVEGYVEERTPVGRIDIVKTAIKTAILGPDAKPVQRIYVEPVSRVVLVVDKSGSMGEKIGAFENIAYAAGIASLVANSVDALFDVIAFDSNVYQLGRDLDQRGAIDRLASISEAGGGTSYSSAIEHAADIAEEGSTVVIVGDFIDTVLPDASVLSKISGRDIKFVLCPTPGYNPGYLEALRRALNAEVIHPDKEL